MSLRSAGVPALLAVVLWAGSTGMSASVIGRSEGVQPLSAERIAALPAGQRGVWMEYLRRSEQQQRADREALAAERKGLAGVPAEPKVGSSPRSMPLDRDPAWYGSAEARHVADVIMSFQIPSGGWGKNMSMAGEARAHGQSYVPDNANRLPSPGDLDAPRDPAWHYVGTLDNDATTTEMHFLAKVQASLPGADGERYRESFIRGVRYLLAAQYPNGGWPQVWPLEGGYHDAITFNDNAVYNATVLLRDVAQGKGDENFVPQALRAQAQRAVDRALECMLAAQVVLHGRKTVWAQQNDMLTLKPVAARNYEPASLSSEESAHLLEYLMSLPHPSARVQTAITAGVQWLRDHAIYNEAVVGGRDTPEGRRVVAQQGAGPVWARFYGLESEKPVFGDRDRSIHDDMNEISRERRNGYAWFNREPEAAIERYAAWKKEHGAA